MSIFTIVNVYLHYGQCFIFTIHIPLAGLILYFGDPNTKMQIATALMIVVIVMMMIVKKVIVKVVMMMIINTIKHKQRLNLP